MALSSTNMYDNFKDDILKELGPLDPDWFNILTAQTLTNEGCVSDQDDLCANQEGHFKTPLNKSSLDSQLFSTPKVFRHNRLASPETEDERSFTADQEKERLPWLTIESPCLFQMSKERVPLPKSGGVQLQSQDSFDLFHTIPKTPVSHAKQIPESLGAQIHSDISWTSSLNTPPAVPSTLILSKTEEITSPVSVSAEKNVIFVRRLFPSLSNTSRVGAVSPNHNDTPHVQQGVVSPEAVQNPEVHDSPQSSLNESDTVWRQKLPDAIEDGEIRSTVASVLEGAENVLSIFFTNSNSALRKVKTDRIKRKQIIPTEEQGCSSSNITATNNAVSSRKRADNWEPAKLSSSPPLKTGDTEITQWSPLNLSDIPSCTLDSCHDNSCAAQAEKTTLTEQQKNNSGPIQLRKQPLKITDSGFAKKKRKFIYTIETSKTQTHGKETQSPKTTSLTGIPDSGYKVMPLGEFSGEADSCSLRKDKKRGREIEENEENLPLPLPAKVQDLDMSQLCRDFAQDFSQMLDPGQLNEVAEEYGSQNGFSPSACLSAMKRSKQKARQANLQQDCNVSVNNQKHSINEGPVTDSGFQSAFADTTHLTITSSLPSSKNISQTRTSTGCETDIHMMASFLSTNTGNAKSHLDDILHKAESDAKQQSAVNGRECELQKESNLTLTQVPSCAEGTAKDISLFPHHSQVTGSFPEKTIVLLPAIHASGFKTASNKDIQISSANLERAKRLFEDNEADHHINTKEEINMKDPPVKNTVSNSNQSLSSCENFGDINCQLTASQKADVTELCTLLEEADSQFEFTQFKSAKLQQYCQDNGSSSQKVDKELDPDFLTGIDFDDSFSSGVEKNQTVPVMLDKMASVSADKENCETSKVTSKSTVISMSSVMREKSSSKNVSYSLKHTSEGSSSIKSAEPKNLDRAGLTEASKQENENPMMPGVGFKTPAGNVLQVSKCLRKAKALFADLEGKLTDQKSQDKSSSKVDAKTRQRRVTNIKVDDIANDFETKMAKATCQSGFQMASGKGIHISEQAMQAADAFFKDCDTGDSSTGLSVTCKKSIELSTVSVSNQRKQSKFKNAQGIRQNVSEDPISKLEKGNAGTVWNTEITQPDMEMKDFRCKNTLALVNVSSNLCPVAKTPPSASCMILEATCSSVINQFSNGSGFSTASGKKLSVSADAMKKAQCLLDEVHTFEDTNKLKPKGDDCLTHQTQVAPPESGGFRTASGKGVVISSAALKKAKSLLSDYDAVESKTAVKPSYSKMFIPGLSSSSSGFLAASGKSMAVSAESLQKAKALFSDITCDADPLPVSDIRDSEKKIDDAEKSERIKCALTTAGGTPNFVSERSLLKETNRLREFDDGFSAKADASCDNIDSSSRMSVKYERGGEPVRSGDINEKRFSKVRQEHGCRDTKFENLNMGPVANHENLLCHDNADIHKDVFKTQPKSTDGNPHLIANSLSSPLHTTSKNTGYSAFGGFSSGGGFCTASGKKVNVSDDAISKAKSLLDESAAYEDTDKPSKGGFPPHSSGKGSVASPAALKKVKSLSECEAAEDKICVKSTHSKMSIPGLSCRNAGFLAASGKTVTFSSEALRKAKALFSDISSIGEIPTISGTEKNDETEDTKLKTEENHCGFKTAGGAKVHVSEKNLFSEFAEQESCDSHLYSTRPHDNHQTDQSKVKDVERTRGEYTAAQESATQSLQSVQETDQETQMLQSSSANGCISIKERALKNASKLIGDRITSSGVHSLSNTPEAQAANVLGYEDNHTRSSKEPKLKWTKSSVITLQSLNLSGCTETQQKFLAQEALDCTRALLEDESLAGQNLSVTSDNAPQRDNSKYNSRPVEEQTGRGKRSVKHTDMTGQPPLKRRLLDEFDRTDDGTRGLTLNPQKSCPSSLMKDRRAFKYSASLHPNVTRPDKNGKNFVETSLPKTAPTQYSTSGDSRSAHSKMPVFVPPFIKNPKTETLLKDNRRTPPAFVPPFKKQRTFVQESSFKPQEEEKEDKHHHVFVTPSKKSTFVPPTKKTESSIRDHKNKELIQKGALADAANDYLQNNQDIPVAGGSEESRVEDLSSRSQDMLPNCENVELARDMQDMRIRKKKRQKIRPFPGSLFFTKTSGVARIPLRVAVNGKPPAGYTPKQLYGYGVHRHVSEITSETAETFCFNLKHFFKLEAFNDGGGVQLADGGWLIPSNDGTAGKEEFYRALCDTPGVDPRLISEEWVYNHYRWIVWKQASMERSFPETMGSLCLTPEQVLLQLKYRYDVEIDHSRRSALRKIMEKDDTAAKTLVLCVCGIVSRGSSPNRRRHNNTETPQGADAKTESPSAVVWLTDGWYAIKAQLDEPLTAMLQRGRLAAGMKLIIYGAQLVGSQDACSPLEAPESIMLKIFTNSSRPARWDTKLGFHKDPRPFLLPVSCLYSNGGPVGCVDMTILRSYPLQWMERKPDGTVVFRSVRAEEKEARRYSSQRQKAMELIFAKIQTEFEKEEKGKDKPQCRRRTISRQDMANMQDGEELYEAVGDDPSYLEAHLSEQQLENLLSYRRSLMERKQAELQDRYRRALDAESNEGSCPKRDITPVWRLSFADSMKQSDSVYQLNLWRPPSDLQSLLKEGCRYKVYNLTASDGKKRCGVETVQLTGTKKTQFQELQAPQEWLSANFQPRISTNFVTLQSPDFQPLCGEVDLTGYVISVIDGHASSPAFYLADGRLNFIKVRCFSSFSQSGLDDLVKPHVLLALSNLQLRGQSTCPTPVVYAGDLTVFSTNPKEAHLQESFSRLRNLVQGQENFFVTCEEKLSHLLKPDGPSSICSPAVQPQTPVCTSDRRQDTSLICQQPIRSLGSFTPVSGNPPAASSSTEKDPRSLKRRRALDYLARIPSPPALTTLGSVPSPRVNKTFNPPRRSGAPSTLKTVQTPVHQQVVPQMGEEWVNDEELAMIDTQTLHAGDLL